MPIDGLQVRIEVLDANDSVVLWYLLPVENVVHQISRTPVVFPIPSINRGSSGGQPNAYAIDFGMMNEQITLKGVAYDYETDADVPGEQQLAELARTGWRYVTISTVNNRIAVKGGVRVVINHGYNQGQWTYQGVVQSFMGQRAGGGTHWDWSLVMQVTRWPVDQRILIG